MKPKNTEDIFELLDGYVLSAALGTAMELGLFWLLAEKLLMASTVAETLKIPLNRCQNWLQLLCKLGLLKVISKGYAPSTLAREMILDAYSQDAGSFLGSLEYPATTNAFTTIDVVQTRLQQAGFEDFVTTSVPGKDHLRWNNDLIFLEAQR